MRNFALLSVSFFFLQRNKKETSLKKEKYADRLICTKFNLSG